MNDLDGLHVLRDEYVRGQLMCCWGMWGVEMSFCQCKAKPILDIS
jgi:hypothetical protein